MGILILRLGTRKGPRGEGVAEVLSDSTCDARQPPRVPQRCVVAGIDYEKEEGSGIRG